MTTTDDEFYPCVGICMADPDSGYCLGCGRPPLGTPTVVAEPAPAVEQPAYREADTDGPA
ncbi:MAG TPA: DUF1289 domain-containing protein [Azonexus sp.]